MPTSPATTNSTTVTTTSVANLLPADLAISKLTIGLFRRGTGPYQYEASELQMAETTGKGEAVLFSVHVTAVGGEDETDCLQEPNVRIAPGTQRDVVAALGYCLPYSVADHEVSEVSFVATFTDGTGTVRDIRRKIDVSNCSLRSGSGSVQCR